MAAVGGFGAGSVGPHGSVGPAAPSNAPVDASSLRSSLKQRRRSANNIVRAPIASAEELSPSSPQGLTPDVHQPQSPPADNRSFSVDESDVEFRAPQYEQAGRGKTRTPHVSTFDSSKDDITPENNAPDNKPSSVVRPPSDCSQPDVTNSNLLASLSSVPGAVRRPHSFVHAMSDQLVLSAEPRRGRGARSPSLETQPEEELSSIFEFSV